MPRCKLTQHFIDKKLRAPHASGRQTIFWDDVLHGFGVLCSGVTNSRTFVVQRDVNGKARRVTVASVAEMKVEEARERARRLLIDMRDGKDPKRQRAGSKTLRETLEAYKAKNKDLAHRSVEIYDHLVLHHLEPWLDRSLSTITPDEVDDLHGKIAQTVARRTGGRDSGATTANLAMRAFKRLYNWAALRDDAMPHNPVRLRKKEWHKVEPVRRPIPRERLADWYRAVTQLPPNGRDWLLLMLFTGLRRREAAALRWEHVDFDGRAIRLPASAVKGGYRKLDLPMVDLVRDLLVARRALGDGGWVFPSHGPSGHVDNPLALIREVREQTGIEFSSHDLRRTYVGVAESCDVSHYALKALINHSIGVGTTESYVGEQLDVDRLREPAQRVADRLKALCGITEPEGVTKLGRK
jgi:integrase